MTAGIGRDPTYEQKERDFARLTPAERTGATAPMKHRFPKGFHRGLELFGQQVSRLKEPGYRESIAPHGILSASPPTYRALLTFLAETGSRINEARHLEWPDVDWKQNVIHIRPKPQHNWRPKSGDQRVVPISSKLRELLKSHSRSGNWLFTAPITSRNPERGRQVSDRRALSALNRVLKRLKISNGHLHTFRHSFISRALSAGIPEAVVRSWVGHVDADVMKLYTHIADKTSQREMARLGTASAETESESPKKEPTHESVSA